MGEVNATYGPPCVRCGRTQYWHPDGSCHVFGAPDATPQPSAERERLREIVWKIMLLGYWEVALDPDSADADGLDLYEDADDRGHTYAVPPEVIERALAAADRILAEREPSDTRRMQQEAEARIPEPPYPLGPTFKDFDPGA